MAYGVRVILAWGQGVETIDGNVILTPAPGAGVAGTTRENHRGRRRTHPLSRR
jgi:hypothetical protein